MTYGDIFIRVLADATGKPESEVRSIMEVILGLPEFGGAGMRREIPDAEAERIIADIGRDTEGTRRWLREGAIEARRRIVETGSILGGRTRRSNGP